MRKLYLISAFSLFWFAGVSQTYNLQIGDPVDGGILAEFPNNSQALFRPYGTATGNTGGIRLFELSANGSNYIGLRAEDNIGSNLMFTLPGSAPG